MSPRSNRLFTLVNFSLYTLLNEFFFHNYFTVCCILKLCIKSHTPSPLFILVTVFLWFYTPNAWKTYIEHFRLQIETEYHHQMNRKTVQLSKCTNLSVQFKEISSSVCCYCSDFTTGSKLHSFSVFKQSFVCNVLMMKRIYNVKCMKTMNNEVHTSNYITKVITSYMVFCGK